MHRPQSSAVRRVPGLPRIAGRAAMVAGLALVLAAAGSPASAQPLGFTITVDGEYVAGDPAPPDFVRRTDVALARTDIQVTFDGFDVEPVLNALPATLRRGYEAGEAVEILLTANYPAWITRAEIRVFDAESDRLIAVLPAAVNGTATWVMPADGGPDYYFTARVYDFRDRFDETIPFELRRTETGVEHRPDPDLVAAGWGADRTHRRTVTVFGGAVTVHGDNVPPGAAVVALGERVPVDQNGSFVIQRILPSGDHIVDVAITEAGGMAMTFNRAINIPTSDWFYVALADFTVGWRSGQIEPPDSGEFDEVYFNGRMAFYLRGKIRGEYLLTAAGDTGEGPIGEMFRGIISEDPQALLRRIDPNEYYPVYGDSSTLLDDAPTSGKFYVRLERGDSYVMWGNFRTEVGDSTLLRNNRALYGATGVYRSENTTAFGDHRIAATAYAARPGSLSERDVLRGTGGSAYFLRRQDIVVGSETVTVEIRNALTGQVVSTRTLRHGADYHINYMQGVVLLTEPLPSTVPSGGPVQSPQGDTVNLVVQYEYTPTAMPISDYALGGQAQIWLTDHLRIGVTAAAEQDAMNDHRIYGADVRIQATDNTFIEAEVARSVGTAAANWLSTDGGLTYIQQPPSGSSTPAHAFRLNAQVDLDDVTAGPLGGTLGLTVEYFQAGFSSLQRQVTSTQWTVHAYADLLLGDRHGMELTYDYYGDDLGRRRQEAQAEFLYAPNEFWEIAFGVGYFGLATPGGGPDENGERVNGGVQVTYAPNDDLSLYAFGQATLWRTAGFARNDRIGTGLDWVINDHWAFSGEVSYGTFGLGGQAIVTHQPGPDVRNYLGFRWDGGHPPGYDEYAGDAVNGFVFGTERRYSDVMSVFVENNYGFDTLTSTYGVTYTPDARWTITGLAELGTILDPNASDFERRAFSLGATFREDGFEGWARGEVRLEDSADNTRDRQAYLFQLGMNRQLDPDWRLLTNLDAVISRSDQADILDGDYIEANVGFAYRPIDNERLTALFRYTFLYDLPGPDQVTVDGSTLGPAQRSHIFSVDANYDINEYLTIGGKYGFRIGEISPTRDPDDFTRSSAHLGILRADVHIHNYWDVLLEGRVLVQPEAQTVDWGALAAVYRGIGEHFRIGVGYNFGRFSDDLTDLVYDDYGVFFNIVAKY